MKTIAKINKKIFCLLLFCMSGILGAQNIFIPDAVFKQKLLQAGPSNQIARDENGNAIRIDVNEDGEIQALEALAVYMLDVHNSQIFNLTGIEYFTNLVHLDCSNNLLTELDLSSNKKLNFLWVLENPFLSFLNVKNGSTFEGIGETDWIHLWGNLPNNCYVCADDFEVSHIEAYLNYFGTLGKHVSPYCTFPPGGDYNTITGSLIFDSDGNGNCEAPDLRLPFMKINTTDYLNFNNSSYTDEEGNYIFFTQAGIFPLSLQVENADFFQPLSENARGYFPLLNNTTQTINICISRKGFYPDLEVVISPIVPAIPGETATYKLVYRNKGNQTLSGFVNFNFDDARMDLLNTIPQTSTHSVGHLGFTYDNLMPFETREILIDMAINSSSSLNNVTIGDTLTFSAIIKDNQQVDAKPEDNYYELNQLVVNSHDSNYILCLEGDVIGMEDVGKELHYLIHFTNTGMYPAENVVVTLDIDPEKYDISSVSLLDTSHPVKARMISDKIEVFFQSRMDTGGHGNILLMMRTNEDLSEGDYVKTRAQIYFDYHYPVRTGEATTFIEGIMATADPNLNASVIIYPNPVKDQFKVSSENQIKSIEIFDMSGRLLKTLLVNGKESTQDIRSLNNGIYVLRIHTDKGIVVQKLIKD